MLLRVIRGPVRHLDPYSDGRSVELWGQGELRKEEVQRLPRLRKSAHKGSALEDCAMQYEGSQSSAAGLLRSEG